ncbi:MAG: hypothetical protein GY803_00735 [Chloroflexi bacterium]|nr:hypothetical protein [Chloroflexota bacterium]
MAKSKKVRRVKKARAAVPNGKQSDAAKTTLKTRLNPAEQFRQEYAYVLKDLRQVLILAVIMFALLIALNLFLQ